MTGPTTLDAASIQVERTLAEPLGEQIYASLRSSIRDGTLAAGSRLPSGRTLAAQLGVSRGTIRLAYDRLVDEGLIYGAGSAGTRVCSALPLEPAEQQSPLDRPLANFTRPYSSAPLPFQVGVPAHDAFPAKTWARLRARAVRADAHSYNTYPDPRGEPELRSQIAGYLAVSRKIQCHADQIIITGGYRQGLMLTLTALQARGRKAWLEDPGYPLGRRALELAGLTVEPIPVDSEGLSVREGVARAGDAFIALVTPGQHAPLGSTLSEQRRRDLLDWAKAQCAWVVEDDYLGELQLDGRAVPALAAGAGAEHVVHLGTFSKSLSPSLGLGFVVAPTAVAERFVEVAAVMLPAPNRTTQLAVAEFLADGHFLRHLGRMKELYCERRALAMDRLGDVFPTLKRAGLGLIAYLPDAVSDRKLVTSAREVGLSPSALSPWYSSPTECKRGFILSVTNLRSDNVDAACESLQRVIAKAATVTPCRGQ